MMMRSLLIFSFIFTLSACATGPCRFMKPTENTPHPTGASMNKDNAEKPARKKSERQKSSSGLDSAKASGNTSGNTSESAEATAVKAIPKSDDGKDLTVTVYKYDGSLQCGLGKAVPLEEMEKELEGIPVVSRVNRPDGLMHIQVCGQPTGQVNAYEIPENFLELAETKGFKKWAFKSK